jgi:glutathione S-transferase
MKLYVVPGSHPCATVMKALELKRIAYKRVDLVPGFHKAFQKAKFGGAGTVPGIVLDDGRKLHGSRAILRELDRLQPDPPLYPTDEEADRWGDEVLQPLVRRLIWMALTRKPSAQVSLLGDAKLFPPTPLFLAGVTARPLAWLERRINDTTPEAVAADLDALPGHLDRIDAWLADGTLGGETAADLQIAPSIRLLGVVEDLKPLIEPRPANAFAERLFPRYPGHVPAGALEVPAAT